MLNLVSGVQTNSGWDYDFPCSELSKMPGFEMLYGGYWMDVTAEDLAIEITTGTCSLCLSGYSSIDYWILGDAFMRGWYNIHDLDNMRMGFVPFASSNKVVPTQATSIPTTYLPNVSPPEDTTIFGLDLETFMLIVLVVVITTFCTLIVVIVFCYQALFNQKLLKVKEGARKVEEGIKCSTDSDSHISLIILQ